ncbi:hypothetical protein AOZ06_40795 [Kibdelosporangium phytohabitans]|uniref:Uncharacterized protein n=1 Tax=Kibdelosporangium phytohabitans TaxID=860235 RepID=A0A0N9I7X7_9PSEU|nr:hypothetical protein [Kibdelosporangium phytohabitans]ALG12361.1 hypothetical protein AOZ06_40795 [Kibdelosporangium phytohabitans]
MLILTSVALAWLDRAGASSNRGKMLVSSKPHFLCGLLLIGVSGLLVERGFLIGAAGVGVDMCRVADMSTNSAREMKRRCRRSGISSPIWWPSRVTVIDRPRSQL